MLYLFATDRRTRKHFICLRTEGSWKKTTTNKTNPQSHMYWPVVCTLKPPRNKTWIQTMRTWETCWVSYTCIIYKIVIFTENKTMMIKRDLCCSYFRNNVYAVCIKGIHRKKWLEWFSYMKSIKFCTNEKMNSKKYIVRTYSPGIHAKFKWIRSKFVCF